MEELKVGRYGRTNLGDIFIFAWLEINGKRVENKVILGDGQKITNNFYYFAKGERIVKHSKNIKDLVQAGDIILYNVNSKMTDIEIVKEHIDARTQEKTLRVGIWSLGQVEIKEILTKEQFDSRKYIVEEAE